MKEHSEEEPPEASSYESLDPTKKFIAKLIFRAMCDHVHFKRWADPERTPMSRKQREEKAAYEQATSWIFDAPEIVIQEDVIEVEDEGIDQDAARNILRILDDLMTFESACAILDWNAEWIRERVPKLTKKDTDRASKKLGFM